jgi:MFS family permease
MIYALPLVLMIREPARETANGEDRSSATDVFRELLLNPSFLLLVVYFTLPAMSAWVVRDWMPAILKDRFSLTQGSAGVNATIYWLLAAMVGAFVGGWLSDRWVRRNIRGRIYISAIGTLLIIIAMFGVGNAGSLPWAVRFLIVFGIGWGFFDTNGMPILGQIARPHLRATGYGIMNFVSIAFGGFSDYLLGAMRDRAVPLNQIFAVFSLGALISVAAVLMIRPRKDVVTSETPA